jgi:ABC-2 type transport system permease protein
MTNSLIQVSILLVVGLIIGIQFSPFALIQTVVIVLLLSFALTSLGLTLGSYMSSLEGFQMIVSFVVFPLFFLSGALFPIDKLPQWLSILTTIDPVTYAVDALRNIMLGIGSHTLGLDLIILLLYSCALGALGTYSFRRMKAV